MKNHVVRITCSATVLLCGLCQARAAEVPQFRDLFNGKDLTGWVNVNTAEDTWTVKDGLLVCSGQG